MYFEVIKPEAITVSPYEWLAVSIATELVSCVPVGGGYLAGISYRSRPA